MLVGAIAFILISVFSYRKYVKSTITRRIDNINKEEENFRQIIQNTQKAYFTKKISDRDYHARMNQHQTKLAQLKKERISLRSKRIKLLNPTRLTEDLQLERMQIETLIKKIQSTFYKEGEMTENEYRTQFQILNERLAELESEKTALDLISKSKRRKEHEI